MEPNPQIPVDQPNPPQAPTKQMNFLPMIILGVVMLLLGVGGGYLLFANKNNSKQSTTAVQISPTISTNKPAISSTPAQTNANCGKEGTVSDASFSSININDVIGNEINVASKKWENDAYLVAATHGTGIVASVSINNDIFASSCTNDYLIYTHGPGGPGTITPQVVPYNNLSSLKDVQTINSLQLADNQTLSETQANATIPNFYQFTSTGAIVNGTSINATNASLQINNSKKLGLIYQLMLFDGTDKLVALVSASSDGKIISFMKY